MIITDKAQIKAVSLKESDKLHLTTSDELECYELIESDLKLPADATFTRSSVAYLSDGTQVPANTPRFEQGRFGKAIMVEEGTTNVAWLISNLTNLAIGGSYEVNNRRFTRLDQDTYKVEYLTDVVGVIGAGSVGITNAIVWTAGSHTISADILDYYLAPGSVGYFGIGRASFGGPHLHANDGVLGRKAYTYNDTEDRGSLRLAIRATGSNDIIKAGSYMVFRYVQVELNKAYATSYIINGTRSPETLTIPTAGVLNPQEGTIEIGCMKPKYLNHNARVLWVEKGSSRFGIHDFPSGGLVWAYSSIGTQLTAGQLLEGQWHYLAMSWNRDEGWAKCYFDGNHIETIVFEPGTNPGFVGSELLGIGYRSGYADLYFNGFFDDLRISSRARSDEEILAAYQSEKPLAADEWTTYKLDFDDKVRITTQGQIICNELIEI